MRITNALSLADTFANYHALSTMDMKLSEMNLWKTFILSLGKLLFLFFHSLSRCLGGSERGS